MNFSGANVSTAFSIEPYGHQINDHVNHIYHKTEFKRLAEDRTNKMHDSDPSQDPIYSKDPKYCQVSQDSQDSPVQRVIVTVSVRYIYSEQFRKLLEIYISIFL